MEGRLERERAGGEGAAAEEEEEEVGAESFRAEVAQFSELLREEEEEVTRERERERQRQRRSRSGGSRSSHSRSHSRSRSRSHGHSRSQEAAARRRRAAQAADVTEERRQQRGRGRRAASCNTERGALPPLPPSSGSPEVQQTRRNLSAHSYRRARSRRAPFRVAARDGTRSSSRSPSDGSGAVRRVTFTGADGMGSPSVSAATVSGTSGVSPGIVGLHHHRHALPSHRQQQQQQQQRSRHRHRHQQGHRRHHVRAQRRELVTDLESGRRRALDFVPTGESGQDDDNEEEDAMSMEGLTKYFQIVVDWRTYFSDVLLAENQDVRERFMQHDDFRERQEDAVARAEKRELRRKQRIRKSDWHAADSRFRQLDRRLRNAVFKSLISDSTGHMCEFVRALETVLSYYMEQLRAPPARVVAPALQAALLGAVTLDSDGSLCLPLIPSAFHRLLLHATAQFAQLLSKSEEDPTSGVRVTKINVSRRQRRRHFAGLPNRHLSLVGYVATRNNLNKQQQQALVASTLPSSTSTATATAQLLMTPSSGPAAAAAGAAAASSTATYETGNNSADWVDVQGQTSEVSSLATDGDSEDGWYVLDTSLTVRQSTAASTKPTSTTTTTTAADSA